jgi:hypothetical protein
LSNSGNLFRQHPLLINEGQKAVQEGLRVFYTHSIQQSGAHTCICSKRNNSLIDFDTNIPAGNPRDSAF